MEHKEIKRFLILAIWTATGAVLAENVTVTLHSATNSAFAIVDAESNVVTTISSAGGVVAGGSGNATLGPFGTVSGGQDNGIDSNGWYATIGGGYYNAATTGSTTVAGGYYNGASGLASTVGGGAYNSALGNYGTVPGGLDSHASGDYSFAAGRGAVAAHTGTFVWADSTAAYIQSTADNQFLVRASGGARFFTDTNATIGVQLSAGGTGWSGVSDRNLKENLTPVDHGHLLDALNAIPMTTWNMKTQNAAIRHMGPMAQDFHAAFGIGETNTHIGYSDADGVALAAIQGLYRMLIEQNAENRELRDAIDVLEQQLETFQTTPPNLPKGGIQ